MKAIVACLVVVVCATAQAAPAAWNVALPKDWTDITADVAKDPGMVAFERQIRGMGATTFVLTGYASPGEESIVGLTTEIPMPAEIVQLTAFDDAARKRGYQGGTELSYSEERTATTWSSTQRIGGKSMPALTRRFQGFLKGGGLRSISLNCYGEPKVCDPLLASATVDTSDFVDLSTIDAKPAGKSMAFRIGALVSSLLVVLALVAVFWPRRRRSPPPV